MILAFTTFSGINDYDYPALSSPSVGLAGMELVSLLKRVPLPGELVEQFDRILLYDLNHVLVIRKMVQESSQIKFVNWKRIRETVLIKNLEMFYFNIEDFCLYLMVVLLEEGTH